MTITLHGYSVSRGVAIGRAVRVAATHLDVVKQLIEPDQVKDELRRLREARDAVADELRRLAIEVQHMKPGEAPQELSALLEVHLMLLYDDLLVDSLTHIVAERRYGAEWALVTQLEITTRQFDEMADPYLRERKADLAQLTDRLLRRLKNAESPIASHLAGDGAHPPASEAVPLVLVANDLSPADMLNF